MRRRGAGLVLLAAAPLALSLTLSLTGTAAFDAASLPRLDGGGLLLLTLHAARRSVMVGMVAAALATVLGLAIGLAAAVALPGRGAPPRAVPALLAALVADGAARCLLPQTVVAHLAVPLLVAAIALARSLPVARAVRQAVWRQRALPHLDSWRLLGLPEWRIAVSHVLPAAVAQAALLLRCGVLLAVQDEAALSFLGVGWPADAPSLGTLLGLGAGQAAAGVWRPVLLAALALAVPLVAARLWLDRRPAEVSA